MQNTDATTAPFSSVIQTTQSESTGREGEHRVAQELTTQNKSVHPQPETLTVFEKSTVEIALQLLPKDGHREGRKIRTAVSVNGKTLRLGSLRVDAFYTLLSSLTGLSSDQLLEHLALYITDCEQQVNVVQQKIPSRSAVNTSPKTIPNTSQFDGPVQPPYANESVTGMTTPIHPSFAKIVTSANQKKTVITTIPEELSAQQLELF